VSYRIDSDTLSAIASRQEIDPRNTEDAWYIAAHPGEFDAETVRIARAVDDAAWDSPSLPLDREAE
jgi:hypothetical protein